MFSSTTRTMALAAGLAVATFGIGSDAQAQDRYLTGGLLGGALGAAIGGAAGGGTGAGIGAAAGIGAGLLGAHLSRGDDDEQQRQQAYQQQQQQQGAPAPQAYQQGYQQPGAQPQGTYQAPPADAALVRDVQTELSALGYDVGAIDGQMSPMTINAVQSYEYNNNLLMTGQVSPQLLDHIRRKRAAMAGQPVPTPTDSAQGQPSYATPPQSTAGASPGQTASSDNCRQVTQTLNVDGKDVVKNVTACRQSDGTWKITE